MKKIVSILLATLVTSSAIALPKKNPRAYEVHCTVEDDRDGDLKISDHIFTFHRQASSRPAWVEHLKVKSTEHDLQFILGYDDEDDLIWIGLRDETAEYGTATYERNPRLMNIFFGSLDFGVHASCSFKPKKIKRQKLQNEEDPLSE